MKSRNSISGSLMHAYNYTDRYTKLQTQRCLFAQLGEHPFQKKNITTHHLTCTAHTSISSHSLIRLFVYCLRQVLSESFGLNVDYFQLCYQRAPVDRSVCDFPACFTFGLLLFMEHHQVEWVVEVLCHLCNIMSCQSVGAVYRFVLQVCPIYAILRKLKRETYKKTK